MSARLNRLRTNYPVLLALFIASFIFILGTLYFAKNYKNTLSVSDDQNTSAESALGPITLLGSTSEEIRKFFGKPASFFTNERLQRLILVYKDSAQDTTATYLYFENDKLIKVKLDILDKNLESDVWLNPSTSKSNNSNSSSAI